jgi:hypothetical protein
MFTFAKDEQLVKVKMYFSMLIILFDFRSVNLGLLSLNLTFKI